MHRLWMNKLTICLQKITSMSAGILMTTSVWALNHQGYALLPVCEYGCAASILYSRWMNAITLATKCQNVIFWGFSAHLCPISFTAECVCFSCNMVY